MSNYKDDLGSSLANAREYARLYIENLKLASTEKVTVLLANSALAAILAILLLIALFFISMGLVLVLAEAIPLMWCFLIMGGVYILVAAVILAMRRRLIADPISRFLSRLFLDPPASTPSATAHTSMAVTDKLTSTDVPDSGPITD